MEAHICNVCRPIVVTGDKVEGAYTTHDADRAPKVGLGSVRWGKVVDTKILLVSSQHQSTLQFDSFTSH